MKRIELAKFGFVRAPELDFSDDGTRFTCYRVGKRVRVSKATWKDMVFLAARIDDGNKLDYYDYSVLPHYKSLDRLNGVSTIGVTDQDIVQLYNDCLAYEKEYEEAENNVKFPTIDELKDQCNKIRGHYAQQYTEAVNLIKGAAVKLVMNADEYELRHLRDYLSTLKGRAEGYDPDTYPQSIQKSAYGRNFIKPDNYDLTETWYLDEIKEIVQKYI